MISTFSGPVHPAQNHVSERPYRALLRGLHKIAAMMNGTSHDADPTLQDIDQQGFPDHRGLQEQKYVSILNQTKHPEYR